MQRMKLGQSGLGVPVFVVGMGGMARILPEEGVRILRRAFELGATWWDSSDDYGTLPLITRLLPNYPRQHLTISSKTYATTYEDGVKAVDETLQQLETDYLDIFYLHYVRNEDDYRSRKGCLTALGEAKAQGKIRAIGLSSHFAPPIRQAAEQPEIDVVLAPWNIRGQLPEGGSLFEMEHAIQRCYQAGKGVVLMKVLASGGLRSILDEAIRGAVRLPYKHAVEIGTLSMRELETDIRLVLGEPVDASILKQLKTGSAWGRAA